MRSVGRSTRVTGILALVSACGGHATETASIHDSPPEKSSDGGLDVGVSDAAVFDGGALLTSSGSRLTVLEPATPEYTQLWDEQKNVACTPQLAADGTERCLPSLFSAPVYSDSSCSHAVIRIDPTGCSSAQTYFADTGGGGQCPDRTTTLYTVGSRIETPAEVYPHNSYPCALLDIAATTSPSDVYYDAVPSDPSEWVQLTEEVVPVTESLAVTMWKGADGSRFPHGLELRSSGAPCERYPPQVDLQESRCVPTLCARPGDGFPNDQCNGTPLAGACGPTEVIDAPSTVVLYQLFETGAVVSPVYFKNPSEGGKCMTLPPAFTASPNPSVFYATGPRLQLDKYPALKLTREGSDRLRIEYLTSSGRNLFAESFYDTKYKTQCWPQRLSDGGVWCVPQVLGITLEGPNNYGSFADPQCTRPLIVVAPSRGLSTPEPPQLPFGLVYPTDSTCAPNVRPSLHAWVEYKGPIYVRDAAGPCAATSVDPGTQIFEPGALVNPSDVLAPVPAH